MEAKRGRYSQKQNEATKKHLATHYDQLRVWVRKGGLDAVKEAAAQQGESMAQYVINAVNAYAGQQLLTPKGALQEDATEHE